MTTSQDKIKQALAFEQDIKAIFQRFPPEVAGRQVRRYLGKSTEEKLVEALSETNENKIQITKIDFGMRQAAGFDCLNCSGCFTAEETLYLFEIPASLRNFFGFRGDLVICPECFAKGPKELRANLLSQVMKWTYGNIKSLEREINDLTKHIQEQKKYFQAFADNLEVTITEDNEDSQMKLVVLRSYDLPF
jgi:hypothetical protein